MRSACLAVDVSDDGSLTAWEQTLNARGELGSYVEKFND